MELKNQKGADLKETAAPKYEEFIEFLNQIYWEGYAEQLAKENPVAFQMEYNEFFNAYNL